VAVKWFAEHDRSKDLGPGDAHTRRTHWKGPGAHALADGASRAFAASLPSGSETAAVAALHSFNDAMDRATDGLRRHGENDVWTRKGKQGRQHPRARSAEAKTSDPVVVEAGERRATIVSVDRRRYTNPRIVDAADSRHDGRRQEGGRFLVGQPAMKRGAILSNAPRRRKRTSRRSDRDHHEARHLRSRRSSAITGLKSRTRSRSSRVTSLYDTTKLRFVVARQ